MDLRPDLQPTLTGTTLLLRPLSTTDFDGLYTAAADPLLWAQHPESNRHEKPVFQRFFDGALASGGALTAIERASNRIIGTSRYRWEEAEPEALEIGWTFVERSQWGTGANKEMKRLMLDHAFRLVDIVIFRIGSENWRSRRAVEKIGGEYFKSLVAENGQAGVVYRLTRERDAAMNAGA